MLKLFSKLRKAHALTTLLAAMVTGAQSADQARHYPDRETITGTLHEFRQHVEPVKKPGGQILHSVIRVVMADGRDIPVDVGAKSNVAKLNLKQGASIQFTGKYEMVSGRPLFVAEEIRVDGKKFNLPGRGDEKADSPRQATKRAAGGSSKFDMGRNKEQPITATNSSKASSRSKQKSGN